RKAKRPAEDYADELKQLIRRGFPDAEFELYKRAPKEYDLDVYGDFEDMMEVEELISDRPTDILLESGIHIHVIPLGRRHDNDS
ncbi:MAG TPA: hypothetical protein VGR43_05150, partial [Dehalococcoidia bacterium]|nr:hypothetical protein [Dehalococcoidia bacterium]